MTPFQRRLTHLLARIASIKKRASKLRKSITSNITGSKSKSNEESVCGDSICEEFRMWVGQCPCLSLQISDCFGYQQLDHHYWVSALPVLMIYDSRASVTGRVSKVHFNNALLTERLLFGGMQHKWDLCLGMSSWYWLGIAKSKLAQKSALHTYLCRPIFCSRYIQKKIPPTRPHYHFDSP